MIRSSIAVVILLGLGLGIAQARIDEPPAGLTVVDWAQIRALYEQHRHTATPEDDGSYSSRNPRQGWRIRFDGRGFTVRPDEGDWSWGLELVSFGVEGAQQAIDGKAAIRAEQGRVSYAWRPELEEWFVNDQRGLDHGWTVKRKPQGAGEGLEFELAVRGGLRPEIDGAERSAVRFLDDSGAAVVSYAGLKAWDADGKALPSHMTLSDEGGLTIEVDAQGARYLVTVDPVAVQMAYIKASNPDVTDGFGNSAALFGETLAVGALSEDSNGVGANSNAQSNNSAPSSGAVYVFQRTGGLWAQQAYIKASNTGAGDVFGSSVALSGDTLAVGAWLEAGNGVGVNPDTQADNSAGGSGAAYVFQRTDGLWAQQAYIKASNTGAGDRLGRSVALSGNTLAVGAFYEESNGVGVNSSTQADNSTGNSGAVYVFQRTGGVWAQQAYIKASNTGAGDWFGSSVALSGDTLAVGAYSEDSGGVGVNSNGQAYNPTAGSGAAYVFQRTSGVWVSLAKTP